MDQNLQNGTVTPETPETPETPAPAADKNTSALVLGLLSFFLSGLSSCLFGLPPFIMGIIAIMKAVKYKKNNGKLDTFSIIGLIGGIVGLVFTVMGTIGIIITMFFGGASFLLPLLALIGMGSYGGGY